MMSSASVLPARFSRPRTSTAGKQATVKTRTHGLGRRLRNFGTTAAAHMPAGPQQGAWLALLLLLLAPAAWAGGDAARGRAIVITRQKGLCLLCHSGPFPEERFQGSLAPSLAGAGRRLGAAELRARITDSQALNPDSIMPSYGRASGLRHVAPAWRDKPILTEAEIEDVVAFLLTLTDD